MAGKAQRKRTNGAGSTWYDDKRKRYVGQLTVGFDELGRQRRRTVTARTQAELEARLVELRRTVAAAPALPTRLTVTRWLTHWLDESLPNEGLKPSTVAGHALACRLWLDPTVGRYELAELEPSHVEHMLATLRRRGLAPNTIRIARSTLRRALGAALRQGLVDRNVATREYVRGVKAPNPPRESLTLEQAGRLLEVADEAGEGALVVVLLGLGVRRCEALGLRWRDVELGEAPTLTVAGEWVKDGRGATYWAPGTKTNRGRTLHLPGDVADRLRRHHAAQVLERDVFGPEWAAAAPFDDFVFTSSTGTPRDPDRTTRLVTRLAAEAGLGHWTPHRLRHSCASLLVAAGVPLEDVSELLGHSSYSITADVYVHLAPSTRRRTADVMQGLLAGR